MDRKYSAKEQPGALEDPKDSAGQGTAGQGPGGQGAGGAGGQGTGGRNDHQEVWPRNYSRLYAQADLCSVFGKGKILDAVLAGRPI